MSAAQPVADSSLLTPVGAVQLLAFLLCIPRKRADALLAASGITPVRFQHRSLFFRRAVCALAERHSAPS